jgi:hypothetical protein
MYEVSRTSNFHCRLAQGGRKSTWGPSVMRVAPVISRMRVSAEVDWPSVPVHVHNNAADELIRGNWD